MPLTNPSLLCSRPNSSLILLRHWRESFVYELLQPPPLVGLGRVDVAFGIGGDAVNPIELARLAPAVAEAGQDFHRLAQQDVDLLVAAVGDVEILLLRVFREGDVPHRPVGQRSLRDKLFLHKLAVALEYLNPIVRAVAGVQKTVIRQLGAVHRSAELLCGRRVRIVAAEVCVVGFVAVSAPISLELSGVGVNHRHSFIEVAIGDVGLIGLRINKDFGHSPEVLRVVAAGGLALMTVLRQELAVLSEFQDVGVVRAVAADPDVAFMINGDPVVRLRPLVTLSRTAPVPDQGAGLIEFENRRGLRAACAGLLIRGGFVRRERVGPMNDPDVVLRVNAYADRHPDVPVVRQRLRPQRINLEPGRHDHGFPLNVRHPLQRALTDEKRDKEREKSRAEIDITLSFHATHPLRISTASGSERGPRSKLYDSRSLPLAVLIQSSSSTSSKFGSSSP